MVTWNSALTIAAWLGPFIFIALFYGLEKTHPRISDNDQSIRSACIGFGIIAVVVNVLLVLFVIHFVVGAAYQVRILDISAWVMPLTFKIILSLLLIDLAQFAAHVVSHKLSWLWRFHKVHHADPHVTGSTALLHHPVEVLWTYLVLITAYVMVGAPIGAILIYGALAGFQIVFAHANIAMPARLNSWLSVLFITLDVHRVHHSQDRSEENSNYGVIFSIWDRLFRTFLAVPKSGHSGMLMGQADAPIEKCGAFMRLMTLPLTSAPLTTK